MRGRYFKDTDALTLIYREGEGAAYTVPLGDDGVVRLDEDGRVLSLDIMFGASRYIEIEDLIRRGVVELHPGGMMSLEEYEEWRRNG